MFFFLLDDLVGAIMLGFTSTERRDIVYPVPTPECIDALSATTHSC